MALALPPLALAADPAPSSAGQLPSIAERAYMAGKIYASIQIYFAHFQAVPELDLDAAYRAYLTEALAAPDRRGFSLATKAFMAQLRNGHSGFNDDALENGAGPALGFRADFIERQWAVTWSGRPDVKAGDIVASLDGVETEAWFQRQRRYVGASSERDQRSRFFNQRYLFPSSFAVKLGDGRQVHRRSGRAATDHERAEGGGSLARGEAGRLHRHPRLRRPLLRADGPGEAQGVQGGQGRSSSTCAATAAAARPAS